MRGDFVRIALATGAALLFGCGEEFVASSDEAQGLGKDASPGDVAMPDADAGRDVTTSDRAPPPDSCARHTCNELGYQCGDLDECGATTRCGSCQAPYACGASHECSCTPATCASLGYECGWAPDGCTQVLKCFSTFEENYGCPEGKFCNGSGKCSDIPCAPKSCQAQGADCGQIGDGCGGYHPNCGDCTAPLTCGGAGVANKCGCTPKPCGVTVECSDDPVSDGCGSTIKCSCPSGDKCKTNHCCRDDSCATYAYTCGMFTSGCGDVSRCGEAPTAYVGGNDGSHCSAPYPVFYGCFSSSPSAGLKFGAQNPFTDRTCQSAPNYSNGVGSWAWCCER